MVRFQVVMKLILGLSIIGSALIFACADAKNNAREVSIKRANKLNFFIIDTLPNRIHISMNLFY